MKIIRDKYYTSPELAKYCVEKTREIIGEENITQYIEPSAGAGVFLDFFDKPSIAYDIEPEDDRIIKADWLTIDLDYKKGRCIIGNPPFGNRNTLAVQFYKKSIQLCDYISFILPISQLNNNQQMYEFDLIYSENLEKMEYSGRYLHCCLNIFKRNIEGKLNKREKFKISQDVQIFEHRRNVIKNVDFSLYDLGICGYGSGILGNIPEYPGQYVKEFYFKILNEKYKKQIIDLIKNTDWENDVCKGISGQVSLPQWKIHRYLKEQIPELK